MTITVGGTSITFNDGTTQSTAAIAPTTANVLAATASAAAGAVGSYAFLGVATNPNAISAGGTLAGSSLRYLGINTIDTNWSFAGTKSITGTASGTPAGTWRAMGYVYSLASSSWGASLWLRIS